MSTPLVQPTLLSRSDARRQGVARYFTGKPCKHGHVTERVVANGGCVTCSKATGARHKKAHRAEIAERERAYWSTRVEQRRAKGRRGAARATDKQREATAATKRRYYDRNKEQCVQRTMEWRLEHPEQHRENTRRYAERHPDQMQAKDARRRERKSITVGDREAIATYRKWAKVTPEIACRWCAGITTPGHRHIDHVTPLARGGTHAVENFCIACPECNRKKGAKLPEEFAEGRAQ